MMAGPRIFDGMKVSVRKTAQRQGIAGPEPAAQPEGDGSRSRRRHRRVWLGVLVSMAVLGLIALILVRQLGSVRQDRVEARLAMARGRNELVDGDPAAAVTSFERGRLLFQRGADGAEGPLLDAVSWLPVAGRTTDAISAIARAGVSTAEAARVLAAALADTPGGLAGLAGYGARCRDIPGRRPTPCPGSGHPRRASGLDRLRRSA